MIKDSSNNAAKFHYELNERLSWLPMILYGIQWFLVTVPILLIIGSLVGSLQFDSLAEKTFYIQKLFALIGIALIIQVLWGHKLPIVIGPATVLVIGIISSQSQGISAAYTSIIIGGAILFFLSFTPLLRKLKVIFTPRIVAVILALIAITLAPTIIALSFPDDVPPLILYIFFIFFLAFLIVGNRLLSGIWKSTLLLWGIILGTLVYRTLLGAWTIPTPMESPMKQGQFFLPAFRFDSGVLLSFLFCYIALLINELGSIQAVSQALGAEGETRRTIRGLRFAGLFNAVNGLFGVIGPVDFSMSPGIIMNTGCASRYALIPAGIGLIVCSLFPSVILFLSAIPEPIMGIVLLYIMISQLGSSLKMVDTHHLIETFDDAIVLALPIMLALVTSFLPDRIIEALPILLRPILANGFVVGVVAVLLMEHTGKRSSSHKLG